LGQPPFVFVWTMKWYRFFFFVNGILFTLDNFT